MEQRAMEVTVLYAKDLNKVNLISKMDVYIIISISGDKSTQKVKTPVDRDGGNNPDWNFKTKFIIDEAAAQQNHTSIDFKVKCECALGDKDIGEVHVLMKELLHSPEAIEGKKQVVSYQVMKPDGKPKGFITFAYQFSYKVTKTEELPSMAYPPSHGVDSSSVYPPSTLVYPPPSTHVVTTEGYTPHSEGVYPPPPEHLTGGYTPSEHLSGGYNHSHVTGVYPPPPKYSEGGYCPSQYHGAPPLLGGYIPLQYHGAPSPGGGYPPPPPAGPGYGYYPPPQPGCGYAPPVQHSPKKNNKAGPGLGAGLLGGALGGLLIGDIISDGGFGDVGFDF